MKAVRGKIRNKEHAQTLRDYSGMSWGRITPTDIDGFVEFGDRVFVIVESKYDSAPLSVGQRLALERLSDAVSRSRHCLLVVCSHSSQSDEEIPMHDCIVTQYRSGGIWRIPKSQTTLREIVGQFKARFEKAPLPLEAS